MIFNRDENQNQNQFINKSKFFISLVSAIFLLSNNKIKALENGLARTPPMGWLSWERFVCETNCTKWPKECINERLFKEIADRLIEDGYANVGYRYVNIDDCWSKRQRDPETNRIVPDYTRFPNGLSGLADYMHERQLLFGTYGDCGTHTCQNYPGQLRYKDRLNDNYFTIDADTMAEWHIDSFKFDACYLDVHNASSICPHMEEALNKTGRPILFSCSWPAYETDSHIETDFNLTRHKCNLWRNYGDIEDSWQSILSVIDYYIKIQDTIVKYHGPGAWFDPDQLVIGNFGLSHDQERAQMAIWSIWSAPLYMSNDLRSISQESKEILLNQYVINIDQDPLGQFGLMVWQSDDKLLQVFVKALAPNLTLLSEQNREIQENLITDDKLNATTNINSFAIVYFNRNTLGNRGLMSISLEKMLSRQPEDVKKFARNTSFDAFDLFDNNRRVATSITWSKKMELIVNPSGVRMIKLVAVLSSK